MPETVLGARLAIARRKAGLSQRRLARRLRRPHSMVSRWESGSREPTVFDVADYAKAVAVPMHVLLSGRGPQQCTRRWSSRAHGWHLRTGFGRQLGLARVEASITRAGVFEATGIRGLRLAKIEAGADPSVRELYLLRDLYRLDLAEAVRRAKLDSHRDRTTVPAARLRLTNDSVNPRITIDGPNLPTTISTPERVEPALAAEPGASTKLMSVRVRGSGTTRRRTVRASISAWTRNDRCDHRHTGLAPTDRTSGISAFAPAA